MDEHPNNTAYHLPVKAEIVVNGSHCDRGNTDSWKKGNKVNNIIAWRKCTEYQLIVYAQTLTELLSVHFSQMFDIIQDSDIDKMVDKLSESLKEASRNLPKVKYRRHIKPYWSEELNRLKKLSKTAWYEWTMDGRPRGIENELYQNYKEAKTAFRRELRKTRRIYEKEEFEKIAGMEEVDQFKFWRYVNRKMGRSVRRSTYLQKDEELVEDEQKQAECWADYYEKLFSPLQNDDFIKEFSLFVESEVKELKLKSLMDIDNLFDTPFTCEEVSRVIQTLPNGKASGFDGITYEHIKNGGSKLIESLVYLYKNIIDKEYVPRAFKLAVKVPIPKGRKSQMTFDDSRGINLLPVLDKVLERLVLDRIKWKHYNSLHKLQGAYQTEQDALSTAFMIDEVINQCCEDGEKAYVGYVDVKKAFDTVWIDGMLYKLYYMGVTGKAWRIVSSWYVDMKEYVVIAGCKSREYKITQGTRQGGVLSPWLYLVYVNELINLLESTKRGVVISNICFGSPMFADDLTMISRMKSGLDMMLEEVNTYGKKWRMMFNYKKTVVMVFGEKKADHQKNLDKRSWNLGIVKLKEVETWKNLGKIWCLEGTCMHVIKDATTKAWDSCFGIIRGGGRHLGLNPIISLKLWKTIGMEKLLYGCELWRVNGVLMKQLEKVQNQIIRIIQGFLPGTSGTACRGLLGLWDVATEIEKRKLYLLGRIIRSGDGLAYKRMFRRRLIRWKWKVDNRVTGFIPDVINILRRYDLFNYIEDFYNEDVFPSKSRWKSIVKLTIQEVHENQWRENVLRNRQLKLYAVVHSKFEPIFWWNLARQYPDSLGEVTDVLRILCGSYTQRGKRVEDIQNSNTECERCRVLCRDPLRHALLYCRESEKERNMMWDWVMDNLPFTVAAELHSMDDDEFITTILGEKRALSNFSNLRRDDQEKFFLRTAKYISYVRELFFN